MRRFWKLALGVGLLVIALGFLLAKRPSPQEQLWTAVMQVDANAIKSSMEQGADATLPLDEAFSNRIKMIPGDTALQTYLWRIGDSFGADYEGEKLESLKTLLKKADLSVQNRMTRDFGIEPRTHSFGTPLHFVVLVSRGEKERDAKPFVQLLLKHRAPVNAKAKIPAGVTPLMLAADQWVVKSLLEAGADPNLVAANGACIMNFIGQEPTRNSVWKLLKKHGGRPRRVPDSYDFPRPIFNRTTYSITGWKNARE